MNLGPARINAWVPPLLIVVLTVSIWLVAEIDSAWLAILAGLNVLLSGGGIVRSIARGLRPVASVFYIFTFAWLGVAPVVQIATGKVAWADTVALSEPQRVATGLIMNLVATLAFFIGAEYARKRVDRKQADGIFFPRQAAVRPWMLGIITFGTLLVIPIAIQANGGVGALFTSRGELGSLRASIGTSIQDVGGPLYALTRILPGALGVSGAILTIYAIQARWAGFMRIRGLHLVTLSVAGIALLLFSNPLSNTRFTAAAAFGSIFLAWVRPRSVRWAFLFAAAMITATLVIYPLANAFRSDTFNVKSGAAAFTSADFDGFQQVINTHSYVVEVGHTWGLQILSGIGFFIPRSLWEGKAEPASPRIAEHAGYAFTNLSLPIHAEFYLEFGWVGIIVGMGILGWLAGRMDHEWLTSPGTKLAMIAPYASLAMLGIIRGPIGAQIPVWGAVVVFLIAGISRGRLPRVIGEHKRPRVPAV